MISYSLTAKSFDTLEEARTRLIASGLPVEVSRMVRLVGNDLNPELYADDKVEYHLATTALKLLPEEAMGFTVWMGRGCSVMTIGLAKVASAARPSRLYFKDSCETYGDLTPNMEVFEHRHSTVCKVLEVVRMAGVVLAVTDTSGYWDSRSLDDLRAAGNDIREQLDKLDAAAPSTVTKLARWVYGYQNDNRPV